MLTNRKIIWRYIFRGLISLVLLVCIFATIRYFLPADYVDYLHELADHPLILFITFVISEVVIGFIPPEAFMMVFVDQSLWFFAVVLAIMTVLSIMSGAIAYSIGYYFKNSALVRYLNERPSTKIYIGYYHSMSGLLVVLAALTPLPFGLISLISGLFSLKFRTYLTYSTFRIFRFGVYGGFLWGVESGLLNL